jgi:hypothetical protein
MDTYTHRHRGYPGLSLQTTNRWIRHCLTAGQFPMQQNCRTYSIREKGLVRIGPSHQNVQIVAPSCIQTLPTSISLCLPESTQLSLASLPDILPFKLVLFARPHLPNLLVEHSQARHDCCLFTKDSSHRTTCWVFVRLRGVPIRHSSQGHTLVLWYVALSTW